MDNKLYITTVVGTITMVWITNLTCRNHNNHEGSKHTHCIKCITNFQTVQLTVVVKKSGTMHGNVVVYERSE